MEAHDDPERIARARSGDATALDAPVEARPSSMPEKTDRKVPAPERDETRAPATGAGFAVLPVSNGRGMTGRAGWVAIGLVAVVALAVLGGRLDTRPSNPVEVGSGGPATTRSATSTPLAPTPAATEVAAPPPVDLLTADELRVGLAAGTLEGRTVLVTGWLKAEPWPCPSPASVDCFGLQLLGLDGVEVSHAGLSLAEITANAADPIAFRVTDGRPALLGRVVDGAGDPLTVHELTARPADIGRAELALVAGWLIGGPPGGARPTLADSEPRPDGRPTTGDATEITVDGSAGLTLGTAALAGPFLVRGASDRRGDAPAFDVIARLDPRPVIPVVPSPSPPSVITTAKQLRAATEDGSIDGQLVAVTGTMKTVSLPCPPDAPGPCTGYFMPGIDGAAMVWDAPPGYSSTAGAPAKPTLASTHGTFIVMPQGGRLVLLGRLTGDLDHPDTLGDIRSRLGPIRLKADPLALTPIAGWLVVGGIHSCPMLGPGATPCPGPPPTLTDGVPSPDGMLTSEVHEEVAVWAAAVGIDPAKVVTPGPFLSRTAVGSTCRNLGVMCAGGPRWFWQVMARYDVGSVHRVTVP